MSNLNDALDVVRVAVANMTPEQRLELFHDLMYGYCEYCGKDDHYGNRQCWNDE